MIWGGDKRIKESGTAPCTSVKRLFPGPVTLLRHVGANGQNRGEPTKRRFSGRVRVAAGVGALTVLSVPYLIALTSPLRLGGDEIVYLSLARRLVTGEAYNGGIGYPLGYPSLLAVLMWSGLAAPWAFVAMNLVALAAGLTAAYLLLRRSFGFSQATALLVCCGTLLVHDVIAVAATPSSDATFFGAAMVCLYLLERAARLRGLHAGIAFAAAAALAAGAVEIRTIGIALWPVVSLTLVSHPDVGPRLRLALRRHPILGVGLTALGLGVVAAAAFAGVAQTGYPHVAIDVASTAGFGVYLKSQLTSLGELATNVSASSVHVPLGLDPLFVVAGVALLGFVAIGVTRRRRLAIPDAFAMSTVVVLLAWPESAPRLWIPVVPMIIGYGVIAAHALVRVPVMRFGLALYIVAFTAVGTALLGNSVRLSVSGPKFADRWLPQDPVMHATYQVAFFQARPTSVGSVNYHALELLRRYEPLASPSRHRARSVHRTAAVWLPLGQGRPTALADTQVARAELTGPR